MPRETEPTAVALVLRRLCQLLPCNSPETDDFIESKPEALEPEVSFSLYFVKGDHFLHHPTTTPPLSFNSPRPTQMQQPQRRTPSVTVG
jgi:hypothetical protein